ncbi:helix-turn-helix domain-containing protein [Agromyces aerolatus]|uniref:helix-turn-helix domain-containing protein n=1 Tax=Agromyces sp. LY-1074 TaxID=3074080 RepID=UPI002857E631|nr:MULTISPECIES: helix-turn-helix domain-containing protein [unclassified Agromyces]MDR5698502.1 helix-turn-helix domain-containing protein [Agromyces sp. LY-1074]MDR5704796.1 helix-turn-helix domain-containing protein [Agromyces sp. LY-1358]
MNGPGSRPRPIARIELASMTLVDPGAAEQALAPYFPALRLGSGEPAEFRTRLELARAPRFSLAEYAFETPGSAHAGAEELIVVESRGERYRVEHRGREVDLSMPYLAPDDGLVATWDTVHARAIALDRRAVEDVARQATGDDGARVHRLSTRPVSREAARYWQATARGIRLAMAAAPEAFESPIIEQAAFHRLAMAFLHVYPTGWRDRATPRAGRTTVARALEYLHEHAGEPISVQEVAAAVSVSSRGLHAAFVRELGEGPRERLRRIRLEGARADLLAAEPGASTAGIARRWGFVHLSRFAADYRAAYGELPNATLTR